MFKKTIILIAICSMSAIIFIGCSEANVLSTDENDNQVEVAINDTNTADSGALYLSYSPKLHQEIIGNTPVALFFYKNSDSTSKEMEKELRSNIGSFPEGTSVMEINFDTEIELKEEYEVDKESTVVILDEKGETVAKLEAPSMEEIREQLEELL